MALAAWFAAGGAMAAGVLGGGLLSAASYWTTRSSVTALTNALAPASRSEPDGAAPGAPAAAWTLIKAGSRYALLALLAYVMIARLRLHPMGLLAGASSVVAAIGIEAVRLTVHKP
jgi:hypothetical protein